jgi:hypothetical protein
MALRGLKCIYEPVVYAWYSLVHVRSPLSMHVDVSIN